MTQQDNATIESLQRRVAESGNPLSERLRNLHQDLLDRVPSVDRIACALYDERDDMLKTFINSTRSGVAIEAYEFRLSDSPSLSRLAREGTRRVLDDIPGSIGPNSPHSRWVLEQGYRSSFTIPLYRGRVLLGFIFYDSCQPAAFDARIQRDLILYATLMSSMIQSEFSTVAALRAAALLARDFTDLRDFETGAHLERMSRYARIIARGLKASHGLTDEYIERLFLFAPLHDIGKIGIPDAILLKPGALTPEERAAMETHVEKGLDIVERVLSDLNVEEPGDTAMLRAVVGHHHEFLDGSGYPARVSGDNVPLAARIITTSDILDALMSHRPYKRPWTMDEALAELRRMATTGKLDPACVEAAHAARHEIEKVMTAHPDA